MTGRGKKRDVRWRDGQLESNAFWAAQDRCLLLLDVHLSGISS